MLALAIIASLWLVVAVVIVRAGRPDIEAVLTDQSTPVAVRNSSDQLVTAA